MYGDSNPFFQRLQQMFSRNRGGMRGGGMPGRDMNGGPPWAQVGMGMQRPPMMPAAGGGGGIPGLQPGWMQRFGAQQTPPAATPGGYPNGPQAAQRRAGGGAPEPDDDDAKEE